MSDIIYAQYNTGNKFRKKLIFIIASTLLVAAVCLFIFFILPKPQIVGDWSCNDGASLQFTNNQTFRVYIAGEDSLGTMSGYYSLSTEGAFLSDVAPEDASLTITLPDYRFVRVNEAGYLILRALDAEEPDAEIVCTKKDSSGEAD